MGKKSERRERRTQAAKAREEAERQRRREVARARAQQAMAALPRAPAGPAREEALPIDQPAEVPPVPSESLLLRRRAGLDPLTLMWLGLILPSRRMR